MRESPLDALRAEIAAITAKWQAVTRERDEANARAAAADAGHERAAEQIRALQKDIDVMRQSYSAEQTRLTRQHAEEIERLTHQHSIALATASANATANVTVNVAQTPNAQPVNTNVQPLALTEESLALAIAQRRASGEAVNSDVLAALFGVSAGRIRQHNAWKMREVTA